MINTLLTAIGIGTIWFWIITLVASIIFIASIENDHYKTPTAVLALLGLIYWKDITATGYGWQTIAIAVAVYAVIGVVWSAFRWFKYVRSKADYYRKSYGNMLEDSKLRELKRLVDVADNKSKIVGWVAWWPWSMFWNILGDFFTFVYDQVKGIYQKITDNAIGKFDVAPEKETRNYRD